MLDLDPVRLAERQLELDRVQTHRFPDLLARKIARMSASPLAFLRGADPLFCELLRARPELGRGPDGEGWLVGDAHLENFGAYRPDDGAVRFDLNDYDEAIVGPFRFDVLRLTTSLILGGRELGAGGMRVLDLSERLLRAYSTAAFSKDGTPKAPSPVVRLMNQVRSRSKRALLDARTASGKGGRRRFVRGARYRDLPDTIAKRVPEAFEVYLKSLPKKQRPTKEQVEILDAALRVAGTGSLGALRVALLVRGKGGEDGAWIFDMKEQGAPASSALYGAPKMAPAERVIAAYTACLEHPPRMLGQTTLAGESMFVRRLAPQEDKLDLLHLRDADLDLLASYLGALLGKAHARGATKMPKRPWSHAEQDELLVRAIAIAGIHEATYLALCRLAK